MEGAASSYFQPVVVTSSARRRHFLCRALGWDASLPRTSQTPNRHVRSVLSLPARANQEAGLVLTPRSGRGRDLDVILEVIGSADRLPFLDDATVGSVEGLLDLEGVPKFSLKNSI